VTLGLFGQPTQHTNVGANHQTNRGAKATVSQRKHHRFRLGSLEACIVYHESTDNRWAENGDSYSWYQFVPSTMNAAARLAHQRQWVIPWEASLREQTLDFRAWWRVDPEAWSTAPLCE
jgi:hypothetical protein